MKRKRVGALVMSVMLVLGTVTPVMAAEARTVALVRAVQRETEPATPRAPQGDPNDVSSWVSDEALQNMSDNLYALADQVLAAYNGMTQEEKDAIARLNGVGALDTDIPTEIQKMKGEVSFDALKTLIAGKSSDEADALLSQLDERFIARIDSMNAVIRQAKDFVSNYDQYLQSGITTAIQLLQDLLVKDRLLYTADYLAQAKTYYDEAVTLKPGVQTNQYIIDFCDRVSLFYQGKGKNLNTGLLDEGIKTAESFAAFLACAPNPEIKNTVFNWGGSTPLTYENIAAHVMSTAEDMQNKVTAGNDLTYDDLALYATVFYGNLLEAYNGVSSAILTSVSAQVADVEYIGYNGDEKAAYEAALKAYQATLANQNYAGLADAAKALQEAAADYAAAAENYAKTEGAKQIEELKKKLYTIKEDIEKYKDYYKDTYLAEVLDAIWMLEEADLSDLSGSEIMELINSAKEVVDKQGSNYSSKLTETSSSAVSMVNDANEWWAFLPVAVKGKAPYAEAIRVTNDLSSVLNDLSRLSAIPRTVERNDDVSRINRSSLSTAASNVNHRSLLRSRTATAFNQINTQNFGRSNLSAASNNDYHLDQYIRFYDAFSADLKLSDGKIQSAAKATAQYVYDSAEKVYRQEAKKAHTADVLQEFRTAIDNLKASMKAWDYEETRAYAAAVKTAEAKLMNDQLAQQDGQTEEAAPNTGDDAKLAGLGLMALFSMMSFAGFIKLRRKNG